MYSPVYSGTANSSTAAVSWVGEPTSHDNLLQCTSNEYTGVIDFMQCAFVVCALLIATVCLVHTHRASLLVFALSFVMKIGMSSGVSQMY